MNSRSCNRYFCLKKMSLERPGKHYHAGAWEREKREKREKSFQHLLGENDQNIAFGDNYFLTII